MLRDQYASTLMNHWKEHHPKWYKALTQSNRLQEEAQRQGGKIAQDVLDLMDQGFYKHEAHELVRDDLYPPPESDE